MPNFDSLFAREQIVGVFRSFQEGGLEFHADLALPYRSEFQNTPMHGQFLLVQLENPTEAVLGRITSFSSEGRLSSGQGEEFNIRAVRENRAVPEDLREQYLKYRVNIRVLGVIRSDPKGSITFVPSHRRLPHVGSPVAFPSSELLQEIAGHNNPGAEIGHFALGEYIYAAGNPALQVQDWMQIRSPEISIKFPVESLVSRRTFIFARAGFGKSNLNKLLFSKLYQQTPTVTKRNNKMVPVGTIIFDPDGEYFWPDDKGRPGLCDVPELADKLVVFTSRKNPSALYQSFVAGGVKLDIRRLRPADVIAIALSTERQEQQNVAKLRALPQGLWEQLVDLIDASRNATDINQIMSILQLSEQQEAEAMAARSNMTRIVNILHDKGSQLMDMLLKALAEGKLCVVDVSQMRGSQALILSGLILRRIFDHNQEQFTEADPKTIPTIAVIEEAQSVLMEGPTTNEPFITWVKEGRKYDLGAVLVTQQPGSIPVEILSQGDNWFVFHLLSAADLGTLRKANAHFSDDLLSVLLNEPIPGQGVFWSSVAGKPYPVPVRVSLFERMTKVLDPGYSKPAATTFARQMDMEYQAVAEQIVKTTQPSLMSSMVTVENAAMLDKEPTDVLKLSKRRAIDALRTDSALMKKLNEDGALYGELKGFFEKQLPKTFDEGDRSQMAFNLVAEALSEIFGRGGWHTFTKPGKSGKPVRWVKVGKGPVE